MQPIFEVTAEICISQCTEYNIAYYFVLQNKRTAYITSLKKVMKSAQLQLNP